jgi:predicted DNA binding CopG/RHH family protein
VLIISPRNKQNTERINIFLSIEHLEAIRREAGQKGTTVSGLIRMIVIEYLNRNK